MVKQTRARLTIAAESASTRPPPPATLGPVGKDLWERVHDEYIVDDVAGLLTLEQAAHAADRAELLRKQIADDGPVVSTAQGLREHPSLKGEMAARSLLLRALGRLGLDFERLKPVGRPPRPVGWSP
jgi:hypothetical protein